MSTSDPGAVTQYQYCSRINASNQCVRCSPGYYLDGGSCVDTCNKAIQYVKMDDGGDLKTITSQCATSTTLLSGTDANGLLYGHNNAGDVKQYACKNTYYTVVDPSTVTYTNLNPWKTSLSVGTENVVNQIADHNPSVKCPAWANTNYVNGVLQGTEPASSTIPIGKDRQIWLLETDFAPGDSMASGDSYKRIACGW